MNQLTSPFITFWNSLVEIAPKLVGALVILVVGIIIGKIVGLVIKEICIRAKLDKYIKIKGYRFTDIIRIAVEWIIYLAFIQSAVDYLGIAALADFVGNIIHFIVRAVGAAIIIIVGHVLGSFFEKEIKKTEEAYSEIIGKVVYFFTLYVAIALALPFLGINPTLVNNILLIIIGSVGLGFAIAVGLGLKDIVAEEARKYIKELKKK